MAGQSGHSHQLSKWYNWHDDGRDPQEAEHHFGTVAFQYRVGGSPIYEANPSYLAAMALTSVLRGFQLGKRFALGNVDDLALLFSKGG